MTMVLEIAAGLVFGSMALLADGWHMASHAAALGITALGYGLARRYACDRRFCFGTGKIGEMAGFTSALLLAVIALIMAYESINRLMEPVAISFDEAIAVAVLGLVVNLASAVILKEEHHHEDGHHQHGGDHNLRAAYIHVVADALTSLLAIMALSAGRFLGWVWLDPVMGIVGGVVIARWSWGLLRQTGRVLLDISPPGGLEERIIKALEADGQARITDLHVWTLGPGKYGAVISLASSGSQPPEHYKQLLDHIHGLAHVTVEVNPA